MNNQDFQSFCGKLHEKYDEGRLSDGDVDSFADMISNVLGRDELRAPDSEYDKLAGRISHDYENDIAMSPLLARMYEICRMYQMFRPRPLTEMEKIEDIKRDGVASSKKYPVRISVTDGKRIIASCWWEDLGGMDEIADKVSLIAPLLPPNKDGEDIRPLILEAFAKTDAGLDPLDASTIGEMEEILGKGSVPLSISPEQGIIALDGVAVERNRVRPGANVRLSLDDRSVAMDAYITYGKRFYNSLRGKEPDADVTTDGTLEPSMVSFAFNDALRAKERWHSLGEVFALPRSDNLVGAKHPLALG